MTHPERRTAGLAAGALSQYLPLGAEPGFASTQCAQMVTPLVHITPQQLTRAAILNVADCHTVPIRYGAGADATLWAVSPLHH